MKSSVIIIGFKYKVNQIKCVIFDIFRIYNYFSNIGYDCYVLTDIDSFIFDKDFHEFLKRNSSEHEIGDFITKLKENPPWYMHTYDIDSLSKNLSNIPMVDVCISYYSGHGKPKGIELPNDEILNYHGLRTLLSERAKKELFIFMDCCYINNMNLTYRYEKIFIRGIATGGFKIMPSSVLDDDFSKPLVILIASNNSDEPAAANKHASYFTKYLIDFLRKGEFISFYSLIEFIQAAISGHTSGNQNITVYSSVCRSPTIPSYIFSKNLITFGEDIPHIIVERL